MTFQQLLYFREVAGTLNFTKAAQNLNITQSALSCAIISLEREVGLPLFVRKSGRNIEITSYGSTLLPLVEEAISSMNRIEKTVKNIREPYAGVVNLAFSYINCWQFMPRMLREFRKEAPAENFSVNVSVNHVQYSFEEEILKGNIDIAFSCLEEMEGLITEPLVKQRLYAVLPPDHPLAERTEVPIDALKKEILIGHYRGRNLDQWIRRMYARKGYHPLIMEYTEDWSGQILKVASGEGIAIMPMVPAAADAVSFVPLDDEMGVRTIYMMWNAGKKLSPAVAFARDYFLDYKDELTIV